MKSVPDSPDTAPILGPAIRPTAPAAPDPAKTFELGNWQSTLPEGLAEKPEPAPIDAGVWDARLS